MDEIHQKIKIVIWGCNAFARQLYQFLIDTRIEVVLFIEETDLTKTEFCDKSVFTPEAFKQQGLDHLPIVIAIDRRIVMSRFFLRGKYLHQFKEKIQEISYHYSLQNQLLHPCALVDFLSLRFQFKPLLFGLQGSGNVLFNQIFLTLFKIYLPFVITREKRTLFFEMLCREYLQIMRQVMLDHVHFNEGHSVHHVAWKIGTSHFNYLVGKKNIPMSIYSFSTRDHIASITSIYHQIPSLNYVKKLQAMRFKIFFIMRNPLDIILSGLNKSGGINKETGEISMHHFCGIASWVIKQLSIWQEIIKELHVLRYESLLNSPIPTIQTMMKYLKLWPSSFLAKKIWKSLSYKQLPNTFRNHFWKGGTGKWEAFFKKQHLLILKLYGIENILLKYGYEESCARINALTTSPSLSEIAISMQNESLHEGYYRDEHYDTYQFLIKQHGMEHCLQTDLFSLVCDDAATLQQFSQVFNNSYFNKIAIAGVHKDYRLT